MNAKRTYLWLAYGLGGKAIDLYVSMIVWLIAGLENEQVDLIKNMVINNPMLFIFGFIPVNVGFVGFFALFLVWVEKLMFEPSENVIKGSLKDKFIKVNGFIALSGGVTLIAGGWAQGVCGLVFLFSIREFADSLYIYLLIISYTIGAMLIVTGVSHYSAKELLDSDDIDIMVTTPYEKPEFEKPEKYDIEADLDLDDSIQPIHSTMFNELLENQNKFEEFMNRDDKKENEKDNDN